MAQKSFPSMHQPFVGDQAKKYVYIIHKFVCVTIEFNLQILLKKIV